MTQSCPGASTSYVTFGDRVNAFLAIPGEGTGPFGAVILGHERYGLVQHTLDLTAKLAASGYVGIAPDMYSRWEGDKDALNRGDIMVPLSDDDIRSYMGASLDYLLQHPQVDSKRIAAMGVCQSGEYPLVLNSARPEICANVVVYGGAQAAVWELGKARQEPYEDIIATSNGSCAGHLRRGRFRGVGGGYATIACGLGGPPQELRVHPLSTHAPWLDEFHHAGTLSSC